MFKRLVTCKFYLNGRFFSSQLSVSKILQLPNQSEKIKVQGWVKSLRKMKELVFFDVSDGSCDKKLQVLIPAEEKPSNLTVGSSVRATGNLSMSPKGNLELNATEVEILGGCNVEDGYPFAPRKSYAADYIRQYLHLRNRTNKFSSLLRIRNIANYEFNKYLHEHGFVNIHTPILTSNDCEGAGEVFLVYPDNESLLKSMAKEGVDDKEAYFDSKVFLTVSGQLHLEAVVHGLSKVYTLGPTFRAENSRSRLHLSEFYMLEAELAFIENLEEVVDVIESLVKGVSKRVIDQCEGDMNSARENQDVDLSWVDKQFPIITYEEAVWILSKLNPSFQNQRGFSKEDEIALVKHCGGIPTFVVDWPKKDKPFYMRECSNDSTKVAALDLLGPNIGEIAGGSLRENDYQKLKDKLPSKDLEWYLELRKFGGVSTGGFGLGFERYLQMILGINNIKDVIPYPRWPHNCSL